MPETKKAALARAKKLGYPKSTVVKASTGEHFIAPLGVTSAAGKKAYAECRTRSEDKGKCAAISHTVDKKARKKG